MASITSIGVGSGLDISGLVTQLVEAETQPSLDRLESQQTEAAAQLSSFGLLRGALENLRNQAASLQDTGAYRSRTTTSANEDVFTAQAAGSAARGSFAVDVQRLASAHKLSTQAGFSSAEALVGTGQITLDVGGAAFSVTIDGTNSSLGGVRDAINGASDNTGVTATLLNVDDGAGGTISRLLLTADETGESSRIAVTVDDDDLTDGDAFGLSRLASAQLTDKSPADLDALIEIDGEAVTRAGNTIDDAIEGVTIELLTADPGNPHQLTVADDSSVAADVIEGFVDSFNSVAEVIGGFTSFDATTGDTGVLFGDSSMRSLDFQLRRAMTDSVDGINGVFRSLASLGITTGDDGKLSVDTARLDAALIEDFDAVVGLLSSETGVGARVDGLLGNYVDLDGLIDARTDGLNTRLADIQSRRDVVERRADALEQRLLAQFTAMDTLVAQLQNTSNFLTQQFTALEALTGRNNN